MADVEIKGKIVVDTGNTGQAVKGVKDNVKGLGDEVKKASGGSFSNLKQSLSGVGPAALDAAKGSGMLNTALNVLKANPIILAITTLVGIIVALIAKFSKMEGVSDALGKAWGSLSGVLNIFINKILSPLIEGFTKLVELFTNGVLEVLDALGIASKESGERMGELTEALDDLEDAEKNSAIAMAESNRKLQEAREIASDANVPIRERIAALKEAARIEKEEADKVVEINRMKAALTMEQIAMELGARTELIDKIREGSLENLKAARLELMSMANVDKEKLRSIDEMIIAAEDAAARSAKVQKKTQAQIDQMEKEEAAKRKAAADAKFKAEADAQLKKIENENRRIEDAMKAHEIRKGQIKEQAKQGEQGKEKERLTVDLTNLQKRAEAELKIIADKQAAEQAAQQNAADFQKMKDAERMGSLRAVGDATQALGDIVGEQTVAGKALGIATATINTYQGVTEALKQKSVLPSPFDVVAKVANVAAVLATGLKAVRSITSVRVPARGGAGSSSSDTPMTSAAPIAPALAATSLNASSIQNIGNAAAGGTTRAFVVETDITNSQERISRINRAARLG